MIISSFASTENLFFYISPGLSIETDIIFTVYLMFASLFGKAFEYIAERMPESVDLDSFDSTIAHVRAEDKRKFLDFLLATLV